jgi:UMF1 family MFS transporter
MMRNWLARVGLGRPELRAWAMYDWANSAFMTTIVAAVFPIYFSAEVAADLPREVATVRFSTVTTIALLSVAVLAPVLGAIADYAAVKMKMLGAFLALGVVATASMFFIGRGDWLLASLLFALANIGASGSFVFYDSLLPHLATGEEIDRVSTAGYALGYIGGGVLLAVNLAWIQFPDVFGLGGGDLAVRVSFVSVAIWWLGFSIPLFRTVREPARTLEMDERVGSNPVRVAFTRLGETLHELRGYRQAFLMLLAFLVYNDGISTIIRMATIYGTEIGIGRSELIAALLVTQFTGIPFAFLFGVLAARIGSRPSIFLALSVYLVISVLGYFVSTAAHFFVLAILVGTVQGGSQALSRSLFASMIPRHKSAEFFGFFAVFEKFAGILGPAIFGMTTALTGSSRNAILSIIAFFVIGGWLLSRVDIEEGRRAARAADEALLTAPVP